MTCRLALSLLLVLFSTAALARNPEEAGHVVIAATTLEEVRALQSDKKYKASLRLVDDLLRADPSSRMARGFRAIAYANLKHPLDALDDFQHFLELTPSREEFQEIATALGRVFAKTQMDDFHPGPEKKTAPILLYSVPPEVSFSTMKGSGVKVVLEAKIQTNGRLGELTILKTIVPPDVVEKLQRNLEDAAMRAAREKRYIPATNNGLPVFVFSTIVTSF